MLKKKTTKEIVKEEIVKKFSFNPKLFNAVHRVRIYIYVFLAFFVGFILSFLFVIHESRYFMCTQIRQPSFIYNENLVNSSNSINVKNILDIKFKSEVDSSITKFVNNKKGFNNLSYKPRNLEKIIWDYIIDSKGNTQLRMEANRQLQIMAKDFFDVFWKKMVVVSWYRGYEYQTLLKSMWCNDQYCAKAGHSEHQTWLAVDLWEATTEADFLSKQNFLKYFEWMNENAYKYGFHNTYQKWLEVDWYLVEPWHWRYVWVDLAKTLYENEYTFAEYLKNLK